MDTIKFEWDENKNVRCSEMKEEYDFSNAVKNPYAKKIKAAGHYQS